MAFSWWRRKAQQTPRLASARNSSPRRHRLRLEALEDRRLLATRIWDGGAAFGDAWTNANNWVGDVAPVANDSLVFPPGVGVLDRTTNNDFPNGTTFNSITFTDRDYVLSGNRITLGPGGILSQPPTNNSTNTINFNITLSGASRIFDSRKAPNGGENFLDINGIIDGAADLITTGGSVIRLGGASANTYTGVTRVNDGIVHLKKSPGVNAIPGTTIVGGTSGFAFVVVVQSNQIPDAAPITLFPNGLLSLNSIVGGGAVQETIGPLTLSGGRIVGQSPNRLTLGADVTTTTSGSITLDEVSLGGGTRTFNVNVSQLAINARIINGSLNKNGPGILRMEGATANTYTGSTRVNAGQLTLAKSTNVNAIAGPLIIGDNVGGPGADRVVLNNTQQIGDTERISVTSSGLLDLGPFSETIGPLTLTGARVTRTANGILTLNDNVTVISAAAQSIIEGRLDLGSATRIFNVEDGPPAEDLVIAANVVGAGGLTKFGAGTMALTLPNAHSGPTTVNAGALLVRAVLQNSNTTVNGGFLGGTAFVGNLAVIGGSASPGPSPGQTGLLSARVASLGPSSTFVVELNNTTPITGHDQLAVNGSNTVSEFSDVSLGATLDVRLNFTPALGNSFKIIDNRSDDLVSGNFKDLAGNALLDGSAFLVNGQSFVINYDGGDGNDVVLTRDAPPAFANRQVTPLVREGDLATLRGTITEPDPNDTFFLDVNWGDGSPVETFVFPPGSPRDVAVTHRYLDDGISLSPIDRYRIDLLWRDQHGGQNTDSLGIFVRNVPPALRGLAFNSPVVAGQNATLNGEIRDPGTRDTFKLFIYWGDGSAPQTVTFPAGTTTFNLTHRYTQPGKYKVTFLLADDDFGLSLATLDVTVQPPG